MGLFDPLLRKIAAYVANHGNCPGDPCEIARALEAYNRLCEDIKRGASADDIARNELCHQRANNGAVSIT